ncbi:hypothetical protein Athai_38930 [Actinocatenispora thailandica]|uniref:Uncharacterized protein n=1 Tax=Actinocatenispora thailandica TaxID=227318 RepID=A0A7R7DR62_9ACTN|nr:hypothetical protein [Actinocatenispora thailandica]BCJ36390.1 hypothetical protein Athai_38930 [Actinocatenispora thailandica]
MVDNRDAPSAEKRGSDRQSTPRREVSGPLRALLFVIVWQRNGLTRPPYLLMFLFALPMWPEPDYLRDIGVSDTHLRRIWSAAGRQALAVGMLAGTALCIYLTVAIAVGPPVGTNRGSLAGAFVVTVAVAITTGWLAWPSGTPRIRLLVAAARCARLLLMLDDREPATSYYPRSFLARLDDPAYRRRRVAGVAWALTRDTAKLTGQPVSAGSSLGELLLWFADNPRDPRRRPTVSAYLVELIAALCAGAALPEFHFAPAARFRTRSPREPLLRQLRSIVSGTLITGVILAFVTAVLTFLLN